MKLRGAQFPIDGMDPQHVIFVAEYLKTRRATQAAEAIGLSPESGYAILKREDVQFAVNHALQNIYTNAQIDAAWVLAEAVDNHYLCRQMGNMQGSNAALNLIAKHAAVDAFAAEKIELASDEQIRARLMRGRRRALDTFSPNPDDESIVEEIDPPVSFI